MRDLFFSELNRYKAYAKTAAFIFLALLAYLSSQGDLMAGRGMFSTVLSGLAVILPLIFSMTQFLLHKRKNHWAYLLHRPLAEHTIFKALNAAGLSIVMMVLVVPLLLILVVLDSASLELIEFRHYLYVGHIALLATFAYFTGVYIALSANKGALLILGMLLFVISSTPSSPFIVLFIDSIVVVLVYFLASSAFKLNVSQHDTRMSRQFIAAVLMGPALGAILMSTQALFYHIPITLFSTHPDRFEKADIPEYYASMWGPDAKAVIDRILPADETQWRTDLLPNLEDVSTLFMSTHPTKFDTLNQLIHQDQQQRYIDMKTLTKWQFSHQYQVFLGYDLVSKNLKHIIDQNGFHAVTSIDDIQNLEPFSHPPRLIAGRFIQTPNTLYVLDFEEQFMEIKFQTQDGEYFYGPFETERDGELVSMATNQRALVFEKRDFFALNTSSAPLFSVAYPEQAYGRMYTQFYMLPDGALFLFHGRSYFGFQKPGVSVVFADYAGEVTPVTSKQYIAHRPLPKFVAEQAFWQSPIFFATVFEAANEALNNNDQSIGAVFNDTISRTRSAQVMAYAIGFTLFSMALVYLLARRAQLSTQQQLFWVGMALFMSLIGVACFMLLTPWLSNMRGANIKVSSTSSNAILN